jgi:hypothetical protein
MNCVNCGYNNNNADALYCKNCGADLRGENNFITSINGKINLLAVFIGLFVSVVVLFIGAISFGGVITTGIDNSTFYIGIVLLAMSFFGAVVTGLIGPKTLYEGSVNGAFLSLIIIILSGFMLSIVLFVFIGITESITNALHSAFGGLASTATQSSNIGSNTAINPLMLILAVVLNFIAGIIGGTLGVLIKNGVKQIFN